MKQEKISSRI